MSRDQAAGIVLAAGASSRFGRQKLTMPFGGATVLERVVAALAAAGVAPIIVVTGPDAPELAAVLEGAKVVLVGNPDPSRGMLSSVQVGVGSLPADGGRFLVALGDQPRLSAPEIKRLLDAHADSGNSIAVPVCRGKRGHPVVFGGRLRSEVLGLGAGGTLRDVVHAHAGDVVAVEFASDAFVCDIDTREQYDDELRRAGI